MHCVVLDSHPPPIWKFQLSLIHFFFDIFWSSRTPGPQGIPIPSEGGWGMDIFWNYILGICATQ